MTFPRFSEEMLAEAAPLALGWSRELCRHVNPSGETCAAYHGIWQYLRLFGINTALFADGEFYRAAFAPAIRRGARRVLVSGCADYATAAMVSWIFAAEGVAPDLTVLDVCETPVRLSAWHAAREGATIETVVSDILDYHAVKPFDIICTHALLGLIPPGSRPRLVAQWRALLVPGGVFATINRLRPGAPAAVRFDAAQASGFCDRVLREAAARKDRLGLGITPDELVALAENYVAQNVVYPVYSEAELTTLMEQGGFRIESLTKRVTGGGSGLTGPTMTGGATYAQLVAIRR